LKARPVQTVPDVRPVQIVPDVDSYYFLTEEAGDDYS
jgi:hypothetical protein